MHAAHVAATIPCLKFTLGAIGCAIAIVLLQTHPLSGTRADDGRQVLATARATSTGLSNIAALSELRQWDQLVTDWTESGQLHRSRVENDPFVAGIVHERYVQRHRGVPVFGGDVVREINRFGQTESLFGTLYPGIDLEVAPGIASDRARELLAAAGSGAFGPSDEFGLVILPSRDGYHLTWTARVVSDSDGLIRRLFLDASNGSLLFSYDDTWTEMPTNTTYDMRGHPRRTIQALSSSLPLAQSDVAADNDNRWENSGAVDAHAYTGFTYDYYRKRFGRQGLDNGNLQVRSLVNPAQPTNADIQGGQFPLFFNNAAYFGSGFIVYGAGSASPGGTVSVRNFAGAIDVVAHELTHGVTQYSSNLIYRNESGALNEAFSDIMGAAIEFSKLPIGSGPGRSDWLIGEDLLLSGVPLRSLAAPSTRNHPDHYSIRFLGSIDNGGVHINSSIANHAFYLAVVGGTHRLSGLTVTGVGFNNLEQIERIFYRAFTQLPANATFAVARAATVQAARDLYGIGSAPERAVLEAWSAVGVQ